MPEITSLSLSVWINSCYQRTNVLALQWPATIALVLSKCCPGCSAASANPLFNAAGKIYPCHS
ncbi:hypothetical protein SPAB_04215 [Salmonella enterica subsp. enterica serovar Paratyphi B str. SPB7]|uniref:Uncharacterized protein n=1 Tax=Salmonella paratyphi B (strain ATCC BAA-1250 / SPB7) TaxID=1016998 RepID=A0A6C6Z6L2_SALPB|nr:hypothetical protein SPAB_04215 [Salmonella enterica subsp. enterica serovar Paratyphi B str. SPB7]